jgi:outer membrane immunogenic protein
MRRTILTTALLVLSVVVASAADMPRRAKKKKAYVPPPPAYLPPPVPAFYDWSGFYVGTTIGGAWANTKSDFSVAGGPMFANLYNSMGGVIAGVQLGYNWQNGPAVLGFETDFQFGGIKGGIDAPPCPAAVCGVAVSASYIQKVPWFGTVRGRVGYASDRWMIFTTVGYAYARLNTTASASAGAITAELSRSDFRSGWTIGGGFELALSRQWTAKMEYLYMDFGHRDGAWTLAGLPALDDRTRFYMNVVRTGLNYRF